MSLFSSITSLELAERLRYDAKVYSTVLDKVVSDGYFHAITENLKSIFETELKYAFRELVRMKSTTSTSTDIVRLLQTNIIVFKENLNLLVSSCIERLGNSITDTQTLTGYVTILRQNYTAFPSIQELDEENQSDTISKLTMKEGRNNEDSASPKMPHYFTLKTFDNRREAHNKSEPAKSEMKGHEAQNSFLERSANDATEEVVAKKGGKYSFDSGYLQKKTVQESSTTIMNLFSKKSSSTGGGLTSADPKVDLSIPDWKALSKPSPDTQPPPHQRGSSSPLIEYEDDVASPNELQRPAASRQSKLRRGDQAGIWKTTQTSNDLNLEEEGQMGSLKSQEYMNKIRKLMRIMTNVKAKSKQKPTIPRITSLRELEDAKVLRGRYSSGDNTPSRQETRASETRSHLSSFPSDPRPAPSSDRPHKPPVMKKNETVRRSGKD